MNKAEQLLMKIYDSFLADSGDRGCHPCKSIDEYFDSRGMDIRRRMKNYNIIEGFINWFIKEQNDDCCQKDIMLDSLVRYLDKEEE